MATLYWDPFSGISGNMAAGSLLDLSPEPERLLELLNDALVSLSLPEGPPGLIVEKRLEKGITGTYFNTVDEHEKIEIHPGTDLKNDRHHHRNTDRSCFSSHHGNPEHHHLEHDHHHENVKESCSHHEHRSYAEIKKMISSCRITEGARERAKKIFEALAQAEARVHGTDVDRVTFHEVGARDSIADILAVAIFLDRLMVDEIFAGQIQLGSGFVKCQHGMLPVPAPATAYLLENFPVFSIPGIQGELTTPTGAAILKGLGAKAFLPPGFMFSRTGFGHGSRNYPWPNTLRAYLGQHSVSRNDAAEKAVLNPAASSLNEPAPPALTLETVAILETNIDNATGELLAHAASVLLEAGALDVTQTPTLMKKGRPAVIFKVITGMENLDRIETLMYRELPTLGIRRSLSLRTALRRESIEIETDAGKLPGKRIIEIDGSICEKLEFESKKKLAREKNIPLRKICDGLQDAGNHMKLKKPQ